MQTESTSRIARTIVDSAATRHRIYKLLNLKPRGQK